MSPQAWQLQLALGACRAGRYLAAASLACALLSLALLTCQPGPSGYIAEVLGSLAVLATLPAFYLGVRLELDLGLFQRLNNALDLNPGGLVALDQALAEQGWKGTGGTPRPLVDRVGGVLGQAKRLGGVVAFQLCAMLMAALLH